MRKALVTKAIALFTGSALILSSIPAAAMTPAAVLPDFARTLAPSDRLGSIVSSYGAEGAALPRLIVIADLHGHVGVQERIIGMLEIFVNRLTSDKKSDSQTRVPVFVEGGWVPHLEEPLKTVQNPRVRAI